MNERDAIIRARNGDRDAFAELYMMYRDRLYRYAYFKLGNETDARDAVSDCITEAYAGIGALRSDKAFPAWIFRILYRACGRIISENTRRGEPEDVNEETAAVEPNYIAAELSEALALLGNEDREIVLLSAVAGYNSREIAELVGMKSVTVRSRLSRALKKMREFLGDSI